MVNSINIELQTELTWFAPTEQLYRQKKRNKKIYQTYANSETNIQQ